MESNQDQTSNVEESSALDNGENIEITNTDVDENYDERRDAANQLTEDGEYSDEDYFSVTSSEEEEEEQR